MAKDRERKKMAVTALMGRIEMVEADPTCANECNCPGCVGERAMVAVIADGAAKDNAGHPVPGERITLDVQLDSTSTVAVNAALAFLAAHDGADRKEGLERILLCGAARMIQDVRTRRIRQAMEASMEELFNGPEPQTERVVN